jgi:hypothetical protein
MAKIAKIDCHIMFFRNMKVGDSPIYSPTYSPTF